MWQARGVQDGMNQKIQQMQKEAVDAGLLSWQVDYT